jgi:alpha-1,2-mannosyltransferase
MSPSVCASNAVARSPVRSRLWKAGICLLVFLSALILTSKLMGPKTDLIGMPGGDLIPSYMAGAFVRTGHVDWLTDAAKQTAFQHQLRIDEHLDVRKHMGPWLNPPYYAWVFVPLSALPYRKALAVWFGLNLILAASSVALLARMLPAGVRWRTWGLIPLLLICSFPFLQAISAQQNSFLSLLLLCATISCWRTKRGFYAGLIAGLMLFKPQLGAILILALCWSMGWRAMLGVAITTTGLIGTTMIAMPGALHNYLTKLPTMLPWLHGNQPYLWERQITWQGFWRLLLQYHATGPAPLAVRVLWPIGALIVGGMLAYTAVRAKRNGLATGDRFIAAVVSSMPLLMPYYMDYDLLLLAAPVVLLAADGLRNGGLDRIGKRLFIAWIALYVWLFFNATFVDVIRINLAVPALSIMAIAQCVRVLRTKPAVENEEYPTIPGFRASVVVAAA